jgi:glutamate dehydrogenase
MNAIRAAENGQFHTVVFDELKKIDYPAERLAEARFFIEAFFERIAPADYALHAPERWAALIADLLGFIRERSPGQAKLRVYNPGVSGTRAVIEVVTDDMPFLVDTVSMVAAAQADIHAIIHPVVPVTRSASGVLQGIGEGQPESVMALRDRPPRRR